MTRMQQTIIPLLNQLRQRNVSKQLHILETGTIRNTNPEYRVGDGWSTYYIAQWVADNPPVRFLSIDLDVSVMTRFMRNQGLIDYVTPVQSDSVAFLSTFRQPIDFLLLDSANDADVILNEFRAAESKLVAGSVVVIDDVMMQSKDVVKGHKIVPYLQAKYGNAAVKLTDRMAYLWL